DAFRRRRFAYRVSFLPIELYDAGFEGFGRARPLTAPVRGAPAFPAAAARLVRAPWPRSSMAQDERPVSHPRLRGDAATDAGRPRAAEVPRVARSVSVARDAGRGAGGGRHAIVVSARLQHPAQAAAD